MATRALPPSSIVAKEVVGARLRTLRKQKDFTLKRLSEVSGVPLSTLSKIELGQAPLSYDKFMAISQALGVEMSQLLRSDLSPDMVAEFTGTATQSTLDGYDEYNTENYAHKFLFSDVQGKTMIPIVATLKSTDVADFGDFIRHPGQEFAVVIKGSVKIVFENGTVLTLKKNDTAYFDSSVGHVYLNAGKTPAQVLAVCTHRP